MGRRQPRERLIEQHLCDLFQTHRGDVRLALFELENKGLIERIPNRGAIVRGLTPTEVREIYAVAKNSKCWRSVSFHFRSRRSKSTSSKSYSDSTARRSPKETC